ncbi:Hypothetical protein PHPALM_36428 [Phytophthora palmivora]|uniref:Uncharacterized protein n=1 Tax=Phytophthora palmivora TaxID=4796 RepID=A0A2P4WZZ6_9STRA|nr:Hypothetical protein PHPALM_36428 [Phytophthora palmivora]
MGLDELKPGNSKRAKNTAISVFKAFAKSEHVEFDYVKQCIEEDATASDLSLVRKQNLAVDADEVFFVRFIRMKTSEELGLSLFPDAYFVTCPLHAIVMALITQAAPSAALIDNLPEVPVAAFLNLAPSTPLLEVLNHPDEIACLEAADTPVVAAHVPVETTPTIYTHVNRLLDRVSSAAEVADALTSHSFRRGGAHHVNGCDELTQRWIFDRGAWNMSTTNKGFNIFNTSREDHTVSKALSGYDTQTKVKALHLKLIDTETQEKIAGCQRFLFATYFKMKKMKSSKYNLSQQVIDVLTAYLIMHYPLMKDLQADGLGVRRVEAAAAQTGVSVAEVLAWSSHLAAWQNPKHKASQEQAIASTNKPSEESKIINHQRSGIDQLMEFIKRQDERMDNLEPKIDGTTSDTSDNKSKKRQQ